jgi:hypothetical protein
VMAEGAHVASTRRTVLTALAIGLGVGLAAVAIIVSIVAIPLFALARFADPGNGLDRPMIRDGLTHVALPAGVVLGTVSGLLVGRWYRRGGHLPTE